MPCCLTRVPTAWGRFGPRCPGGEPSPKLASTASAVRREVGADGIPGPLRLPQLSAGGPLGLRLWLFLCVVSSARLSLMVPALLPGLISGAGRPSRGSGTHLCTLQPCCGHAQKHLRELRSCIGCGFSSRGGSRKQCGCLQPGSTEQPVSSFISDTHSVTFVVQVTQPPRLISPDLIRIATVSS